MKKLMLVDHEEIKARVLFVNIVKAPPKGGAVDYKLMAARVRVIEALEDTPADQEYVLLEDNDHTTLLEAMRQFPFGMADRNLFKVLKQIEDAETVKQGEK